MDGSKVLDEVETFLRRFVAYPSPAACVAHTLWIAHTWLMDAWESTPRIAFLSPEPGSGKSRALEVTETLVPRPVHAVNTTPAYLFRKVADPEGAPTILYDEIDTVFGPKAKDNEDIRGMLNAGHRRGAVAGRCVVKGKTVTTEELAAYCAVALAGLNDLPDTIMTRAVVVRMRRRAATERVEPWRHRLNAPQGEAIADRLSQWAAISGALIGWPDIPEEIQDRNADVWEALIAVADLAGGDWPGRARVAAVALVADLSDAKESLGVMLLRHLKALFGDRDRMWTEDILSALHAMPEAPWGDMKGVPIKPRFLGDKLKNYEVHSKDVRIDNTVKKGYLAEDLHDPWSRYVADEEEPLRELRDSLVEQSGIPGLGSSPMGPENSATSATSATDWPLCLVCGGPMTLHEVGQTTHPGCEAA